MGEITKRFRDIISKYGPEAILPYSYAGTMGLIHRNAGHAFFHKLGASRLRRTICSTIVKAGFEASLGPMPSTDIESAAASDLVVIWGGNTLATNLHAWRFFSEARKAGALLVVVDPYRNRTAGRADLHLRVRPGTDAALVLGLMHVIVAEGMVNSAYVERHTSGFSLLKGRVREYPPERVARMTAIPEKTIIRLARLYGKARAPYIRLGYGVSRQLKGGMAVRTISLLPALVGAFQKKGGGLTCSTSMTGHLNTSALTRPDLIRPGTRRINMVRLGHALTRLNNPPVKGLFVYLSNPAVVAPESRKVLAGLAREDLFTVVHEQFPTDTARFADLILPGTTFLEHTDLYAAYGHYYLQMARPVIPPVGECRPPLSLFQELAARFGFKEGCFTKTEAELIRRILPSGAPFFEGITYERLSKGRPLRLQVPRNPFKEGFATPSGKVEFYSQAMAERGLDPLPDGTPSEDPEGGDRYPLHLLTPPCRYFLNSTFNEIDFLRERAGKAAIMIHPEDARVRGIVNGEPVRIFNDRGECRADARITGDTAPGVTVIEGLYWAEFTRDGLGVNQLTSQRLADMGESCAFHCNRIEVEPARLKR